ncbi:MAG TPA: glutamyl-tRNA reductase [Thioalkalivibrio sp.]|nr:glutamyl-tRNA reductase [Thioalkalivibrio sp.]
MSLITVGINHKTAPVDIRERVVFAPDQLDQALRDIRALRGVREAAILSTCNRTELYCTLEDDEQQAEVIDWLGRYHHLNVSEIEPYLYLHEDETAVRHMLRVACGLDSLVLGEPQILGQLKTAFQQAANSGAVGRHLNRLFQHAFAVAKQVRTDTAIGASPVSVAFAAVSLARRIFGDLGNYTALMIGAGETIELAAQHLHANGIGRMLVANRNAERARHLAEQYGGEGFALPEIGERLHEADIVVSSTAAPLPILGKGAAERALKKRKHRPMFMVDIAVPRDIEPEVANLDDVYLYTVDDLEEVIQENMESRQQAAAQAEEIVDLRVEDFMGWLRAQGAIGTIVAYRERAEAARHDVHEKAERLLAQGRDPQEVLEFVTRTLTNKLTHDATSALNQAAHEGDTELLHAAIQLLNLNEMPLKK